MHYISSSKDFFKYLRQGKYAYGYPVFFFGYGKTYSFDAVLKECKSIGKQFINDKEYIEFPIEGCAINWESEIYCEISGKAIESAY
jgi:hypothetical protein